MQVDLLLKYFPEISAVKIKKYENFVKLFSDWNTKINLISRKDIENILEHHILHSLSITKVIDIKKNINIIDVGTGGGFPGIPLAIMFPETNFDLVDSIAKKIKVVKEISEKLELKNVNPITERVENLTPKYDYIISRAVTNFPNFYKLTKNLFRKDKNRKAIIYLKGGNLEDELKDFQNYIIYKISDFFEEEYFCTKKIIFLEKNF